MKLQYIFLAILIMNIASSLPEDTICSETYYWILNNLDTGNVIAYSDLDFEMFRQELNISSSNLTYYINNYTEVCEPIVNLSLPPEIINLGEIEIIAKSKCLTDIDRTLLWGSYKLINRLTSM